MLNVYEELAEASRRQILGELRSGPKNVSEIVASTGLKQPNVSNHLARMRARGIVKDAKVGRQVYYTLANPEVESAVRAVFALPEVSTKNLNLEELAKQYAKAAIAGDEEACGEMIDAVIRANTPLIDLYQDFLAVAMTHVGTWYKVEAIDEGQEHLASEITQRMMARASDANGPIKRHGKTAVLGCPPGSWHLIGLRMVSDYLKLSGWTTVFLGANVPEAAFVSTVIQHKADLVLLNCNSQDSHEQTLSMLRVLSAARPEKGGYSIGIGGRCLEPDPTEFLEAGADFSARDLRSFANEILPNLERHGVPYPALAENPLSRG